MASAQAQQTRTQQASPDETAFAVPRFAPPDGGPVGLPQPMPPSEARRVRRIFALHGLGRVADAIAETRELTDPTLLADILADRYLGACYRASADELTTWLQRYPELPDAPAIRAQLLLRLPHGAPAPDVPAPFAANPTPPEDADPSGIALTRDPGLDRAVHEAIHAGRFTDALQLVGRQRRLDARYLGQLHAEIARGAFAEGHDERALALAQLGLRQSRGKIALAGFVGGLAAWRLERPLTATSLFEQSARAALAPPSLRAASAFWAARAHLRMSEPAAARYWLRRAGAEPRTFYGMLAGRLLGIRPDLREDSDGETLGEADVAAVDATPQGHRAFALLQVGQTERAADALRQLWPAARSNPGLGRAILLVAKTAGLTGLGAELATLLQAEDGKPRDDLRFPMPKLSPRGGFKVDPAIVYGLARLESNFDADAVSPAGARGLMQLMPVTAGVVAASPASPETLARRLNDPAINLELGQRYLLLLAGQDTVDGDLIRLLASYNAGPAAAARWMDDIDDRGDPLLFIESIPLGETRDYVRRALTYIWIYAARLHRPAPGLDALAAGLWPRFPTPDPQPAAGAPGASPAVRLRTPLPGHLTDAAARSQL